MWCPRAGISCTPITWTATTAATRWSDWCRGTASRGAPSRCPTSPGLASKVRRWRGAIRRRVAIRCRGSVRWRGTVRRRIPGWRYAKRRDRLWPDPTDSTFFLSARGLSVTQGALRRLFLKICQRDGLGGSEQSRNPRLHDLRHTFADKTLLRWHCLDVDVDARLPRLATYLGHVDVRSTYWYLIATPELLGVAATRLDRTSAEAPS